MFHRVQKNSGQKDQGSTQNVKTKTADKVMNTNKGMNQTAVRQYAGSQEEVPTVDHSSNQNLTAPYAVQENVSGKQEIKEVSPMNNPESKDTAQPNNQPAQSAQARVDIPGNNFQRPGAPAQPASRPSYPGTYPGAASSNTPSYNPQTNNEVANGRQLQIGPGITLSGEIEACDHLVVEGTVEAALKGASKMDIAESGAFFGTVEIEEAVIAGRFEGDITVKGRLTIQSTGTIIGTVSYKELSMEAGAVLDGAVSPIGSKNSAAQAGGNKKTSKSKKVSQNSNGAELPFSDRPAEAAE